MVMIVQAAIKPSLRKTIAIYVGNARPKNEKTKKWQVKS